METRVEILEMVQQRQKRSDCNIYVDEFMKDAKHFITQK